MEKNIQADNLQLRKLMGDFDVNRRYLEKSLGVKLEIEEKGLRILGEKEDIEKAGKLIVHLLIVLEDQGEISKLNIDYGLRQINKGLDLELGFLTTNITKKASGKILRPKTLGQLAYIEAIRKNTLVFGIGPAGTGKTYLAMAMAIDALRKKEVNRIILTRPAVEAGESLGFLPGDLQEKVDPYLRPIYDSLYDILGSQAYERYLEKGMIEIAPLAYMRGRTLDNAYIILDEAQNTSKEQMKMFLTRLGFGSKAIITGDITQIDLPKGKLSGLKAIEEILKDIEDIAFIHLSKEDVVRHSLVQKIIDAYEKYEDS